MTPRGRPKVEEPRDKLVQVRLTAAEHKLITEASKASGKSASEIAREPMLRAAKRLLK